MSLAATRELAAAAGVEPLALLRANRDRRWMIESGSLAFEALRPGDVLRHPGGGEIEIVRMGQQRDAPLFLGDSGIVADYQAQLNTRISSLGAQGASTLQSATGVDVTQSRVSTGAAAALSLAQNGFDPTSTADEQQLVTAIAGGACLIPVVGPAVGAGIEVLNQAYTAAACPLLGVASSLGLGALPPECGGSPCTSTGNWSTSGILQANASQLPALASGSFAELVVSALAQFAAQAANCKASLPPGVIVDAAVNVWNQTHAGPAAAVLVPPLNMTNSGLAAFGPPTILNAWQSIGSGPSPSQQAGKDPYAFYAFAPLSSIPSSEHANPNPPTPGKLWPVAPTPSAANASVDPPRIVTVNTGAAIAPTSPTMSAGQPALATRLETGKTYIASQTIPAGMSEATFLGFMPIAGFSVTQILWWGPSAATDDPAGYLQSGWLGVVFGIGQAAHALSGDVIILATYAGPGQDVAQGVDAYDVTGSMTPRQTVLAAPASSGLSTGAKVAIGAGAAAAAGGGLWLLLGRPLTIQALESAFGRLLARI